MPIYMAMARARGCHYIIKLMCCVSVCPLPNDAMLSEGGGAARTLNAAQSPPPFGLYRRNTAPRKLSKQILYIGIYICLYRDNGAVCARICLTNNNNRSIERIHHQRSVEQHRIATRLPPNIRLVR